MDWWTVVAVGAFILLCVAAAWMRKALLARSERRRSVDYDTAAEERAAIAEVERQRDKGTRGDTWPV